MAKKAKKEAVAEAPDLVLVSPLRLSGIAETDKGFALATCTLALDGSIVDFKLGRPQTHKQFIAAQHVRQNIIDAGK